MAAPTEASADGLEPDEDSEYCALCGLVLQEDDSFYRVEDGFFCAKCYEGMSTVNGPTRRPGRRGGP